MNFGGKPFPVWLVPAMATIASVAVTGAMVVVAWLAQIVLHLIG